MCKSTLLQTTYTKTVSRLRQPESSLNSPLRGRQQAAWPKYPHGRWIIARRHWPLAQKSAGCVIPACHGRAIYNPAPFPAVPRGDRSGAAAL